MTHTVESSKESQNDSKESAKRLKKTSSQNIDDQTQLLDMLEDEKQLSLAQLKNHIR